jgi:hypothetical protein
VLRPLAAALLLLPALAGAQSRGEVSLFAETVAGGVQYLHGVGPSLFLGAAVGFGPSEGVDIKGLPFRDVDPWATGYLNLAVRTPCGVELSLSPVGAIVVIGDDFGVVYPSAQAQLSARLGRFRLGTIVRTIRVAGANDSAEWWTQWIPLRLGFTL